MTDCRLRHAQPLARLREAALGHDRIEDHQQVEVQPGRASLIHIAHRLFAEFSLPFDAQSNSNFHFRLGTRYIKVCKTITNYLTTAPDGILAKCGLLIKILCKVRCVPIRNPSSQKSAIASGYCAADCFFRIAQVEPQHRAHHCHSCDSPMAANDPLRDSRRASRREPGPPPAKH